MKAEASTDCIRTERLEIGGHFNAEVGSPLKGKIQSIGRSLKGTRNSRGDLFANFAVKTESI